MARRSVALLEKTRQGNKPFFLAFGFRRPHTPYIALKRYFDLYPTHAIPMFKKSPQHLSLIPPVALIYPPGTPQLSDRKWRETTAAYYAAVSFLDAPMGLLLDALERRRLWDDSV